MMNLLDSMIVSVGAGISGMNRSRSGDHRYSGNEDSLFASLPQEDSAIDSRPH